MTKKLYVSRHVTFIECLTYFTLPPKAASIAKEDLTRIDPFRMDVPTFPMDVPKEGFNSLRMYLFYLSILGLDSVSFFLRVGIRMVNMPSRATLCFYI